MEEILHQWIASLSQYLQDSIHPRCCRISSINSINWPSTESFNWPSQLHNFLGFQYQSLELSPFPVLVIIEGKRCQKQNKVMAFVVIAGIRWFTQRIACLGIYFGKRTWRCLGYYISMDVTLPWIVILPWIITRAPLKLTASSHLKRWRAPKMKGSSPSHKF